MGALAVLHDASFIKTEASRLWWNTFLRVLAQAAFIVLVTLLIIRWSIIEAHRPDHQVDQRNPRGQERGAARP